MADITMRMVDMHTKLHMKMPVLAPTLSYAETTMALTRPIFGKNGNGTQLLFVPLCSDRSR